MTSIPARLPSLVPPSPAVLMSRAVKPPNSNTAFGSQYAAMVRRIAYEHAERSPRSMQVELGPSEIGSPCDRQVVGKLAGIAKTNHIVDPWASIVGTALHAWLADAFRGDNDRYNYVHWLAEFRVHPHPDHPGTGDLYDFFEQACVDHKGLGETPTAHLRKWGPPQRYFVQLLAYARGFRLMGLPVKRILIVCWPRTKSTLDPLYVWDHELTPEDDRFLDQIFELMKVRKAMAVGVRDGRLRLSDITPTPDDQECYFCLTGDTEVPTRYGIQPINELVGKAELLIPHKVAVDQRIGKRQCSRRGNFQEVPVYYFGKQSTYEIKLQRLRSIKTIRATAEHQWILEHGQATTTKTLQVGMRLADIYAEPVRKAIVMPMAIAQGFTYGDGSQPSGDRPATLAIYGKSNSRHILPYFGPVNVKTYTHAQDTVQHIYGLPRYWKELPPIDESRTFLLNWLAGYFAADGTVSDAGQATLNSADKDSLLFVRGIAAICGIRAGTIKTKSRVGTGTIASNLHGIDLSPRDLPEWFWILPHHTERIHRRVETKIRNPALWVVSKVTPTNCVEDVYCAVVPHVKAFALADGVLTGNCPFYRPDVLHDSNAIGCAGHHLIPGRLPPGNTTQ